MWLVSGRDGPIDRAARTGTYLSPIGKLALAP
jgi:hypothetical protein